MALNLQTNKNQDRFFYATQDDGAQTLGLQFGTTGGIPNFSTMAVTISGSQGNGVVVTEAPQYVADQFMVAGEAMAAGLNSTYFTLSTINIIATGTSISYDQVPGSGTSVIENYSAGASGGFNFQVRGVGGELVSTILDPYFAAGGREGSVVSMDPQGALIAGGVVTGTAIQAMRPPSLSQQVAYAITDLSGSQTNQRWAFTKSILPAGGNTGSDLQIAAVSDNGNILGNAIEFNRPTASVSTINRYPYPQTLFSTIGVANQVGTALTSNTPAVIFTQTNSNLTPGNAYLTDVGFEFVQIGNPGASGAFIDLGVRLGGNGPFNYGQTLYVPSGGITFTTIASLAEIAVCGNSNQNIDILAYLQGPATLSVSTNAQVAQLNYLKNVT